MVSRDQLGTVLGAFAVLLCVALAGCGGSSVAVRVGPATVSTATLDHWALVAAHERSIGPSRARREALEFLIFSHWLIGEASERHLLAASGEVSQRVEATRSPLLTGSESNETQKLKASGRTAVDLRFEVETELAYVHLRKAVISAASAVSLAEVQAYYGAHRRAYFLSERRDFDIDNLRSDAAARKVKTEVEAGRRLHPIALHEHIERATAFAEPGKVKIERAILAAKPGELIGPIVIEPYGLHSIFIVHKIRPRRRETLAEAKASIESQLRKRRQQQALQSFNAAWQSRWVAKTDCGVHLLAQRCREFKGTRAQAAGFALEATGLWATEHSSLVSSLLG
jgi:hypothetical protein